MTGQQPHRPENTDATEASVAQDYDLLTAIIAETLARAPGQAPSDTELRALVDVARGRPTESQISQPIVADLVDTVLLARFTRLASAPKERRDLAVRVAETLWNTPAARERLVGFWDRLCRAAGEVG